VELIVISFVRLSNRIRLYSIKTFKSLGTLDYHKNGVQALTFAHSNAQPKPHASQTGVTLGPVGEGDNVGGDDLDDDPDDDGEFSNSEIGGRRRWLVAGGKDGRISIWELMDFAKPKS
jgi:WD40 repeat protein